MGSAFLEGYRENYEYIDLFIGILFCFLSGLLPKKLVSSVAAIYFGIWTGILAMTLFTDNFIAIAVAAVTLPLILLAGVLWRGDVSQQFQRFIITFFAVQRTSFWVMSFPIFELVGGCGMTDNPTWGVVVISYVIGGICGIIFARRDESAGIWVCSNICIGAVIIGTIIGRKERLLLPGSDYCCYVWKTVDEVTQTMRINAMDTMAGFVFPILILGAIVQFGVYRIRHRKK